MTASTLAAFAKAAPFRPFYLKMADGSVHTVLHPEMIAVGKRLAIAFAFGLQSRQPHRAHAANDLNKRMRQLWPLSCR